MLTGELHVTGSFLRIVLISAYWDSDKLFQSSNKAAESVIPL